MSLSAIPKALREQVFARDLGRCRYCQLAQVGQAAVFHIDHVVPRSRGGATALENLALQCPYCSLHKSDKIAAIDPSNNQAAALFHPLRERWDDHFTLDSSGICRGITPTGRATVTGLRMNDPLPRLAREMQIRMGLLIPSPSDR